MTAPSARVGLGATITFVTSGIEVEITKATWVPGSRTSHPSSHLGTELPDEGDHGSSTFIPGKLVDPGTLKLEVHFAPGTISIIENPKERVRITLPLQDTESVAAKFEVDGFVTNVGEINLEPDGLITQSFDVKLSGNTDFTPAVVA